MPLLSVVLVADGGHGQLEASAGSVLAQDFTDVELVAIDDATAEPAMLDDLAARDPRVRVRHLPRRAGAAEARNLALDTAEGDYVWFMDAGDLLPPGSLARAAERLRETAPDVLLVHHSTVDARGRPAHGPHRRLLARVARDGAATLEARPRLGDAAPCAWDKVLRRDHLRGLGARFAAGCHGELTVTWPALLTAAAIAAAPAVGYLRRGLPDAGLEGSPLDVFAHSDAVAAFIDARADVPEARRATVAPALLRHQLSILQGLRGAERREFFRRMSQSYDRHRTGAEPLPAGRRERLVAGGRYRAFELLEASLQARRALRRRRAAAARLRRRAKRARLDRYYRSRRRRPVDPRLAVYAAYWFRGYACNPRAIYEKARELAPDVRGVWVVKPDAVATLPPGVDHVVAGTREYYDVIARAGYFVNNVNFPNHLVKREGTVHVMTHHGTPLKRMGLDLRETPVAGRRMDFAALLRRCERWDYSVSSNAFSTQVWERVYPARYESLEAGYPRNDALVAATEDDVRRIREALGIRPDQTAVLYAPTHREYEAGHIPVLDVARVADALGPDHVLLTRLHYFYDADPLLPERDGRGRMLDVASHPSVEELCLAADVLVTDYSSLMFDYAVLDRPIVIHAPDWEVYRAMRGTYFDLLAEPPGIVARTERELIEALASAPPGGEQAGRARAAFRARFCSLEDGRAAERVVRRVWLSERSGAAPRVASGAR